MYGIYSNFDVGFVKGKHTVHVSLAVIPNAGGSLYN
jgi:hypothetical protein